MAKKILEMLFDYDAVSSAAKELESYDKKTYEHCLRVCLSSITVYKKNIGDIDEHTKKIDHGRDKEIIGIGALLHDIGKIYIPKEILHKNGLTEEEFKIIEEHPLKGFEYLQDAGIYDECKDIVLAHHEYDWVRYPSARELKKLGEYKKIRAPRLEEMIQIVGACDVFDAVTHREPLVKGKKKIKEAMHKFFKGDEKYIEQILECKLNF